MIVIDLDLLGEFRRMPCCEWCHRKTGGLHVHHLWCRGMGGGGRLDIRANIIALCPECHRDVHDGHIIRADLVAIVAKREGLLQVQVEAEIHRLRRLDKDGNERRK